MDKIFIIAGSIPFLVLGAIHLIESTIDTYHPSRIVPYEPGVIDHMRRSTLTITKETTVWRAWLGFNLSHSLGVLFFGFVYFVLAVWHFDVLRSVDALLIAAPVLAVSYLVLSLKYWFRVPAAGSAFGAICLIVGVILAF